MACIAGLTGCAGVATNTLSSEQKLAFSAAKAIDFDSYSIMRMKLSKEDFKYLDDLLKQTGRRPVGRKKAQMVIYMSNYLEHEYAGYYVPKGSGMTTAPPGWEKTVTGTVFKGYVRFEAPGVFAYEQTFESGSGGPPPAEIDLFNIHPQKTYGEDWKATLKRMLFEIDTPSRVNTPADSMNDTDK